MSDVVIIEGTPIPLARARYSNGRFFNGQAQQRTHWGILLQSKNIPLHTKPIAIELVYYLPIAKGRSKEQRAALNNTPHFFKPDIDNLIKFTLDAANTIIYSDDCLIYSVKATKLWTVEVEGWTELRIIEL